MFTGIIQEVGRVTQLKSAKSIIHLSIRAPKMAAKIQPTESVTVNGVCLTVVSVGRGHITFEMIPETQRLTSLKQLRLQSQVNLESSLSVGDRFNGHVVLGHVDGVGTIVKRKQLPGELILTIRVSRDLRKYLVSKGSVAIDGVSLTIGKRLTETNFTIQLIPETLKLTTLGFYRVGGQVNIEVDYFAKLFYEWLRYRKLLTNR